MQSETLRIPAVVYSQEQGYLVVNGAVRSVSLISCSGAVVILLLPVESVRSHSTLDATCI